MEGMLRDDFRRFPLDGGVGQNMSQQRFPQDLSWVGADGLSGRKGNLGLRLSRTSISSFSFFFFFASHL